MPVKLHFGPQSEKLPPDQEIERWWSEFRLRSGEVDRYDEHSVRQLIDKNVRTNGREEHEVREELFDRVEEMKASDIELSPLHSLHTSRENITHVERNGELPEEFISELNHVVAEYIDGFIPDQRIEASEAVEFSYEKSKGEHGSHIFSEDKTVLYSKFGDPLDGTPAASTLAHETIHRNNIEAIVDKPERVRSLSLIYENEVPESYREFVKNQETAEVHEDLLGALALQKMGEKRISVFETYQSNSYGRIGFENYTDVFQNCVEEVEDEYDLAEFDIRDETMAQAVSFFIEGRFEESFDQKLRKKRRTYNNLDEYSETAGDRIVENLKAIKDRYTTLEGSKGERFKEIMSKRISFLKNEFSYR